MSKHNPSEDKVFNPSPEALQPLEPWQPIIPRPPDWWRCLRLVESAAGTTAR